MGAIIYWAIVRFAVLIGVFWFMRTQIEDFGDWWGLFFLALGVVVLYPAQIMYERHKSKVRIVNNSNSLCTTCKYYNRDEALCTALDELITSEQVPCESVMWEPR